MRVCVCVRMSVVHIICLFIFVSDLTQLMVFDDSQCEWVCVRLFNCSRMKIKRMNEFVGERVSASVQQCAPCVASTLITTRRKNDTLLCFHHNQFIYIDITYFMRTYVHMKGIAYLSCMCMRASECMSEYYGVNLIRYHYQKSNALWKQLISIPNKNKTRQRQLLISTWLKHWSRSNIQSNSTKWFDLNWFDLFCFIIKIVILLLMSI